MMSGTALDHPLVRGYLVSLDQALRRLPVGQARELREQITSHLDEALPPGAGDGEVREVLDRLGSPAGLVTEAAVAAGATSWSAGAALRIRLGRIRRRTWVAAAAVVVLAAVAVIRAVPYIGAGPLESGAGLIAWWYPQDISHEAEDTQADGTIATIAPGRFGQRQGYVVALYNPTGLTQTITGVATGHDYSPDNPGGALDAQIGVSVSSPDNGEGSARSFRYALPGSIPPHQTRLVRVLWTTRACLTGNSILGIDTLNLRVRVGWFPRSEVIPLGQQFILGGPDAVPSGEPPGPGAAGAAPARPRCRG